MTNPATPISATDTAASADPLLVEDLLLLLFQPDSGTIAGENILFYVLGAASLGDLALAGRLEVVKERFSTTIGPAREAETIDAPLDPLLIPAWSYISQKPRDAQTTLAAIGPELRGPVLDRLVERGDLTRHQGRALGIFPSTRFALGSDRRARLMDRVRAALLDGETPGVSVGAAIALLSASGTLPQFYREIPWSGDVYTRGKELERGDAAAMAASSAVTRTLNAVIANAIVAAVILPRA